jgi:hypothetical protein
VLLVAGCTQSSGARKLFASDGVIEFATTPGHMYWLVSDPLASSPSGGIYRMTEDGPKKIVSSLPPTQALAADDSFVYWSDPDADKLYVAPNDGSAPPRELVSSAGAAVSTALDDQFLYWSSFAATDTSQGKVQRVPKAGGVVETLASSVESPSNLRLDADSIYWMTAWGHAVLSMPKAGGAPQQLMTLGPCGPWGLAIDADSAYASCQDYDGSKPASSIVRVAKTGGSAVPFATSQSYPSALTVDASSVYWVEWDGFNGGEGNVVEAAGGNNGLSLASVHGAPVLDTLAADGTYVYWTTSDTSCASGLCAEVWRIAK